MSVSYKDYYATLGVAREATAAEIKKAFRKLAREHHPDVAKNKAGSEAKFKEINEAYEVLGDPEKRGKYDRLGADWQNAGAGFRPPPGGGGEREFQFGGTGFSDFFEQYFSGGGSHGFPEEAAGAPFSYGGGPRARRGGDVEGSIMVTLGEAMHGTVRTVSLKTVNRRTGKAEASEFQVRIPPGVVNGRKIRVAGHGEAGQGGGPAGDLLLRVMHAAHPDFTSSGADIFHQLDLAPWDAVLGAEIEVPTLDSPIHLRVPAGAENGMQLRVRGRGLPKGKSGERGDFFAVVNVLLPPAPSGEERELWEKLREVSKFQPRG
jgi:curved DNA-binding protein